MKKILVASLLLSSLICSCSKERASELDIVEPHRSTAFNAVMGVPEAVRQGQIIIKVSPKAVGDVTLSSVGQIQMSALPSALSRELMRIQATSVERLFPHAGQYEERTVREGLHRWMKITFDESVSVGQAMNAMIATEGVEVVEYVPLVKPAAAPQAFDFSRLAFKRSDVMPYNDPELKHQWHYNNLGDYAPGAVKGADVNLFKAWGITTGTPNVVVCVVDGGIDVEHPDIIDNLWVNQKEKDGRPDFDDDGNGYVDDVNGYCFVLRRGDLKPDASSHGMHVAGTVAARTNNNIGVAGVAGGNGQPGTGVRLMSAAIFREGTRRDGDEKAAIKYGADNGAVISQNSWSYPPETGILEIPQSLKEAIDYFVKYAGCDNQGRQLPGSPMKGGLVFAAAGNYNKEYTSQPAAYENVIAVTAVGPNFERASYSNYGDWADIAAPGGDQDRYRADHAGVLSTVSPGAEKTKDKSYAYYQGTSMACPHVSGIAALVLSAKGGPGYTNEMLKQQLLAAVFPVDINEVNPYYSGKLGVGFIDAYAALTIENKQIAPERPTFVIEKSMADTEFTQAHLYWTVPRDADDEGPAYFKLYYSEQPLDKSNYTQGAQLGNIKLQIPCLGRSAGDEMSYLVEKLKPSTTYHYALVAVDRWGLVSEPAFFSSATKANTAPRIVNMPTGALEILSHEQGEYSFEVQDAEGHDWSYTITGQTSGVTHTKVEGGIKVKIRPVQPEGEYSLVITLTDELKTSQSYTIKYRLVELKAPVLRAQIPPQLVGVAGLARSVNLSEYVDQPDQASYTYAVVGGNTSIVQTTIEPSGKLLLKGVASGKTPITIEIGNGHKTVQATFEVTVVEDIDADVYSVWPLPIKSELNVWVNPKHSSATIELVSVHGEVVFSKQASIGITGIAVMDMKRVAPGSYTLRVKAGDKPWVKSVLKR